MVCRACSVVPALENTVICGNIEHPADIVKTLDAWRAAAAFQILLEGQGVVEHAVIPKVQKEP